MYPCLTPVAWASLRECRPSARTSVAGTETECMFGRLRSWWRGWLIPSWLSNFLMLMGFGFLGEIVGAWHDIWRIELAVVALIVGFLGQRKIKKVTLIERTPESVAWRVEYKTKRQGNTA